MVVQLLHRKSIKRGRQPVGLSTAILARYPGCSAVLERDLIEYRVQPVEFQLRICSDFVVSTVKQEERPPAMQGPFLLFHSNRGAAGRAWSSTTGLGFERNMFGELQLWHATSMISSVSEGSADFDGLELVEELVGLVTGPGLSRR
jgi:hypothetical protein